MAKRIEIREKQLGEGCPVYVVAEIGSNHNQEWGKAKQLIEAAAESGADAVKFQLMSAEDLYTPGTTEYETVKAVELPTEWIPDLSDYANQCSVDFFASAFSRQAIDILESADVPAYKWASSETTNLPLLRYGAGKQKPILISTGMCDLADVFEAIEIVKSTGNDRILLLQCTSLYPTEPAQVHLRVMEALRDTFHVPVGLSDHTMDTVVPVAAVARGASVIEKHMTLDRQLQGPDHGYALEPPEFRRMIDDIRIAEEALGEPKKRMLPGEMELARRASIRAAHDISERQQLTEDMLTVRRPAGGIEPRYLDAVVGCSTRRRIRAGDAITWDTLED